MSFQPCSGLFLCQRNLPKELRSIHCVVKHPIQESRRGELPRDASHLRGTCGHGIPSHVGYLWSWGTQTCGYLWSWGLPRHVVNLWSWGAQTCGDTCGHGIPSHVGYLWSWGAQICGYQWSWGLPRHVVNLWP